MASTLNDNQISLQNFTTRMEFVRMPNKRKLCSIQMKNILRIGQRSVCIQNHLCTWKRCERMNGIWFGIFSHFYMCVYMSLKDIASKRIHSNWYCHYTNRHTDSRAHLIERESKPKWTTKKRAQKKTNWRAWLMMKLRIIYTIQKKVRYISVSIL